MQCLPFYRWRTPRKKKPEKWIVLLPDVVATGGERVWKVSLIILFLKMKLCGQLGRRAAEGKNSTVYCGLPLLFAPFVASTFCRETLRRWHKLENRWSESYFGWTQCQRYSNFCLGRLRPSCSKRSAPVEWDEAHSLLKRRVSNAEETQTDAKGPFVESLFAEIGALRGELIEIRTAATEAKDNIIALKSKCQRFQKSSKTWKWKR